MTQVKAKCQRCGADLIPATKVSMGDEIEIRLIPCECMFRGDAHEESLRNAYWDGYTDHQAEVESGIFAEEEERRRERGIETFCLIPPVALPFPGIPTNKPQTKPPSFNFAEFAKNLLCKK